MILMKRLTLVIEDGCIEKVFYPVFSPGKNAEDVLAWLWQQRSREGSDG
jgi:peroxiredoxin